MVPQRLYLRREMQGEGQTTHHSRSQSSGKYGMVWAAQKPLAPTQGTHHLPLHGQGLPQERREDRLLVVVGQQENALDEVAPHLLVFHHGQVDQDGTQDLSHLGRGRASPGQPGPQGSLALTPLLQRLSPNWTVGKLNLQHTSNKSFGLFPDFISVWCERQCALRESCGPKSTVHLLTCLPSTPFFLILELYFLLLLTARGCGGGRCQPGQLGPSRSCSLGALDRPSPR